MNDALPDLRQLETFAAVMSVGSITGAARLLGRSQSAVTRLVQDLEAAVGYELLHRNGPRISPTEKGIQYHDEVQRLLAGLRQMGARAIAIRDQIDVRPIEVYATPALSIAIMPAALATLPPELLPSRIHLQTMSSAEHVGQSILSRSADLGITSLPVEHSGIEVQWIAEAPCVAVVRADDPLSASPIISVRDIAERRLITMANPYRMRRRITDALAQMGVEPGSIIETNASLTALALGRAGLGVAVIEPATAYGLPIEGLTVRPLDVYIPFMFCAITPALKPLSATVAALIAEMKIAAANLLPGLIFHDVTARDLIAQRLYGTDSQILTGLRDSPQRLDGTSRR